MTLLPPDPAGLRVIAPCLGKRFSGINASIIAVLPELAKRIPIAAAGFHLPEAVPQISLLEFLRHCRHGPWRIWHARRNIDMVVGLILRHLLRFRLKLVFTSAAQRRHSRLTRFYYHRMDALIATTQAAASFLDRDASVVRHGVNTVRFAPPENRSAEWAGRNLPGRYGIGVFGRIRPQKGTEEFISAMIEVLPQRPDWSAVLVGQIAAEHKPFANRLRERLCAAGLEERVRFVGYLRDPDEIPRWYKSLSVVVCPSRVEGFGLSCLEAMASGCPVVATRTGAWPEIISEDRNGYLVPCGDTPTLAAAILKITLDPRRAAHMGVLARETAASAFRIQDEAEGILSVYRQLLPNTESQPSGGPA